MREVIKLPELPLNGFSILGLTNNNIKRLPSEEELLKKLPDLKVNTFVIYLPTWLQHGNTKFGDEK